MHPLTILRKFIISPSSYIKEVDNKTLIRHIFSYVFFGLMMSISIIMLVAYVNPNQYGNISSKIETNSYNEVISFLALALFAPVYEELIFRGLAAKASPALKRVFLAIFVFVFLFSLTLFPFFTSLVRGYSSLAYIISILPLTFIITFVTPINWLYNKRFFVWFVYLSSLVFGLIHISNNNYKTFESFLLAPFLIVNQLYLGLVASYLASRYGITKAILLHLINNSISALLAVSAQLSGHLFEQVTFGLLSLGLFVTSAVCFFYETIVAYKKSKSIELTKTIQNQEN
jgi:membrane protease YdiL (CAAX protease family)